MIDAAVMSKLLSAPLDVSGHSSYSCVSRKLHCGKGFEQSHWATVCAGAAHEASCWRPAGALQDLRKVNLASNLLSGSLDGSWTALPKLKRLELLANNLNGSLPGNLFRAPALRSLNLQANSISGTLPAERGQPPRNRPLRAADSL